ncbi:MAG: hypothetical protein LBC86_10920 [Oscillospiraceae bacterium]|nr:hypothetical protein [Oscillospiraceae bacterium]
MFNINKNYKRTNISKPIRFNEELLDRMMEFKGKHDISFNSLVLQCCEYALDNYKEAENENEKN